MPLQSPRMTEALYEDTRRRSVKQKEIKQIQKQNRFTGFWKSQATKINEDKLQHYIKTGNERKANIYGLKLGK